jgi:hypothetical protein
MAIRSAYALITDQNASLDAKCILESFNNRVRGELLSGLEGKTPEEFLALHETNRTSSYCRLYDETYPTAMATYMKGGNASWLS